MITDNGDEFLELFLTEVSETRARLESDPWPAPLQGWTGPIPYEWKSSEDESEPNAISVLIDEFAGSDVAARVVLIRVLVAASVPDDDDEWSESRVLAQPAKCRAMARDLLRTVDVAGLACPERIRWELAAAGWAGDLERVIALVRRLLRVNGELTESWGICARTLYRVLARPVAHDYELGPVCRADERAVTGGVLSRVSDDEELRDLCERLDFVRDFVRASHLDEHCLPSGLSPEHRALNLFQRGLGVDWVTGLASADADSLRRSAIQLLYEAAEQLDAGALANLLIRAWARAAMGAALGSAEFWGNAGREYLRALEPRPEGRGRQDLGATHAFKSALECFEMAGDWPAAESAARRWFDSAPSASAARAIAKACHKQDKVGEALAAYETYVRLASESADVDWVNTLLLRVGLDAAQGADVRKRLIQAAAQSSHRRSGEMILGLVHPWYQQMTASSRERWWAGVFVRTLGREGGIGEQASVDLAADCFGEVVNFECREHVLYPFIATLASHELSEVKDDTWRRIIDRRPTLGDCINAVIQADRGVTSIARAFNQWLWRNQPDLASLFKRSATAYQEMNQTRGKAQHGNVSHVEADAVMRRAAEILAVVRRQPAAPAQDGPLPAEAIR